MQSLADAVLVNAWEDDDDIQKLSSCWVALADLDDERGASTFTQVAEVISIALFSFVNHYDDELCDVWEEIFERAHKNCGFLQPEFSRIDVSDFVLGISKDHIMNLASDESITLFMNGWSHLVWKRKDDPAAIDRDAAKAVIVAYTSLFGSIIFEISEENREEISEFIFELASEQYSTVTLEDAIDLEDFEVELLEGEPVKFLASEAEPVFEPNRVSPDEHPLISEYFEEIRSRRLFANLENSGNSKPLYNNEGADYLAMATAIALNKEPKPIGMAPQDWAKLRKDQVVVLDAQKVVLNPKPTLKKAPQSAIKGRLLTIFNFFAKVEYVDVIRATNTDGISYTGELIDKGFAVILYRSATPIPRYRPQSVYHLRQI